MQGCEIWLCRVVLHPGPVRRQLKLSDLTEQSSQAVMAKIIAGELGTLPDGCIVEPVMSYATELDAAAAREKAQADRPDDDWRVVVTMAGAA